MDMLYISDLYKRFSDKKVLNGLNLSVPEHSIFGFIGKNGAGKTTTMKMVLGLLKADAGEIIVNGEKVVYGQTTTNRYIGYLPDVPEFYPFMTAAEYLHFCGEIIGMKRTENEERCKELLELVGLVNETHHIKGFSRGMKQRLGIRHCLCKSASQLSSRRSAHRSDCRCAAQAGGLRQRQEPQEVPAGRRIRICPMGQAGGHQAVHGPGVR